MRRDRTSPKSGDREEGPETETGDKTGGDLKKNIAAWREHLSLAGDVGGSGENTPFETFILVLFLWIAIDRTWLQ